MQVLLRPFKNSTIKGKLLVMVMSVTFIAVVMTFLVFIAYDVVNIRNAMVRELSLLSDVIGKRTATALEFSKAEKAADNLTDFQSTPSVLLACLYTSTGEKLTEFHQGKELIPCPAKQEHGYKFAGKYLTLSQDIFSISGRYIGSMYIVSDMREIAEHLLEFGAGMGILMLITMAISYFIALGAQKIISAPIASLTDVARSVHVNGHYSVRVTKQYNDELGILADTFNEMLSEVQQRDKALKDVNENLEQMVKERTHDLELAKIKAEDASRAKSEFLRNMSHEFRTPLHGMRSFSDFGIKDAETVERSELKGYFQKIATVTDRLTTLVEGVLNIAQMESGMQEFLMEKSDMIKILESVITEQQALMQKKNVRLIYQKPEFDTAIICNEGRITQVVANLMGNAIKFTPSGSSITLEAKIDKNSAPPVISISVSDEGVGVPEEERESIFQKFVQSSRTKTNAGGTGLGLTICMGIVKGHGGKIWVENNENGGATFTFTIPLNIEPGRVLVQADAL